MMVHLFMGNHGSGMASILACRPGDHGFVSTSSPYGNRGLVCGPVGKKTQMLLPACCKGRLKRGWLAPVEKQVAAQLVKDDVVLEPWVRFDARGSSSQCQVAEFACIIKHP